MSQDQSVLENSFGTYPAGQEVKAVTFRSLDEGIVELPGLTIESILGSALSTGRLAHDIYLQLGASGSPLLNAEGEVVGMNTSFSDTGQGLTRYLDGTDKLLQNTLRRAVDGN